MDTFLTHRPPRQPEEQSLKVGGLLGTQLHRDYPVIDHGKGVFLYDTEGRDYLDGSSGAIVANIGHGVEAIATAAREQISQVAYSYRTQFANQPARTLAEKILDRAEDKSSAFFLSSGSEANEAAIRLCLQYWRERGQASKQRILSRHISYHGNTLGALSLSSDMRRRELAGLAVSEPLLSPCYCYRCPFGKEPLTCGLDCADDLEHSIRTIGAEQIAAYFTEPIIGATGGAIVPHEGYFARIREICDRHDILLVVDEVITGFGRTGKWFAMHHWGVASDITVLGKGLNAGYAPLSAVLINEKITETLANGSGAISIGNTHSGNPLSAAICNAVLDYVDGHDLVTRARELGPVLEKALRPLADSYAFIGDIRGLGLLWAIELVQSADSKAAFSPGSAVTNKLIEYAFESGLIIYPCRGLIHADEGDAVLIAPPLTVTESEIDMLVERLDTAIQKLAAWLSENAYTKGL